jgi:hypothetical protein
MMKGRMSSLGILALALTMLVPLNTGCDGFLRRASDYLERVAERLDDAADDGHDGDFGDFVDDVLDDVEDWFD